MIIFLKALNEERMVNEETLKLTHNWHNLQFPLQYGYGTIYFKLPWFINVVMNAPWGHSSFTGSLLYYSEDPNLHMAGSINQIDSKNKPFRLMGTIMKAIKF
jgi:D-alanyl-D-alanine carboxypeptidase